MVKIAKIILSKLILDVKKSCCFSCKNINLGKHFLAKTLFSSFNVWTTLFSKIMPNIWQTDIHRQNFFLWFLPIILLFKAESLQEGIFFLLQLFARDVLVMKKLKIEKTKPAFIISTFKTDIIKVGLVFSISNFFIAKTSLANNWRSFSSSYLP